MSTASHHPVAMKRRSTLPQRASEALLQRGALPKPFLTLALRRSPAIASRCGWACAFPPRACLITARQSEAATLGSSQRAASTRENWASLARVSQRPDKQVKTGRTSTAFLRPRPDHSRRAPGQRPSRIAHDRVSSTPCLVSPALRIEMLSGPRQRRKRSKRSVNCVARFAHLNVARPPPDAVPRLFAIRQAASRAPVSATSRTAST
jgi:hypothetical protein